MGEEYVLCINNDVSDLGSQIKVLKLTSGKFKPTNSILKDTKVVIN